ncbi:hypothetical protein JSQ81_05560 [Sporosarcina sp. Marseille-Q4063]|uniref:DUF2268 domain-containing protein n=1 Tax=Sporosarcina sp. Marseille-Q4063 TaxID=2810514 RepID=UPI001BAEC67C|nr:DUF2268 domain-containing putative Zn-dependent protease [Sporosarcina sp. Marseille-Q4063]QUW23038.1 hypothetical protein JSQ81_05560 [Sporosarcina sp. Marseille-Q4063]
MKQIIKLLIILLSVIFTLACSNDTIQIKGGIDQVSVQSTYNFSYNGQEIEIIYFFEEMLNYTKLKSENPTLDNEDTFTKAVLMPFQDKSSIDYYNLEDFLKPTNKLNQLEENTNELLENAKKISRWIEEAIVESIEILPGGDTTFYVFPIIPDDWFAIMNMKGVSGASFFGNKVILMLDPSFEEEMLKYAVAHEYNHTVHMSHNGTQGISTILDRIITEGKADNFAKTLYPAMTVPWTVQLSENEETAILEKLNKIHDSTNYEDYDDFLYDNSTIAIPMWADYKIGYKITESFINKNPNTPIPEWTKMDAKELVKKSDYSNLLE